MPARTAPLAPWLQTAKLRGARFMIYGVECRCLPKGDISARERSREPLLFGFAMCALGIAPALTLALAHLLHVI